VTSTVIPLLQAFSNGIFLSCAVVDKISIDTERRAVPQR